MKILCLHGKGTSAKIFESQTRASIIPLPHPLYPTSLNHLESFRRLLPSHYEYEFLDGDVPMSTYKEISDFYPGPYLCYHGVNSMDVVEEVRRDVRAFVEEEGPFDGVMGFSQGCALAASMILYHDIEHPFAPPLFRFAIFICGGAPFSSTPSHGADVTELYMDDGIMRGDIVSEISRAQEIEETPAKVDTPREAFPQTVRRFNAKVDKERVQIPTGHVYGAQDIDFAKSRQLVELCEDKVRYEYVHKGGHNIPLGEETSRCIADLVRKVVARSEILC